MIPLNLYQTTAKVRKYWYLSNSHLPPYLATLCWVTFLLSGHNPLKMLAELEQLQKLVKRIRGAIYSEYGPKIISNRLSRPVCKFTRCPFRRDPSLKMDRQSRTIGKKLPYPHLLPARDVSLPTQLLLFLLPADLHVHMFTEAVGVHMLF